MNRSGLQLKFSITIAITAALTRIERARGFLEAATLSEDWVLAMGKRALVLEAHHTTHIEGTRLTLDQAERLMAGGERLIQRDILAKEHGLSERQVKALGHVMEHGSLTIQDYEVLCPGINRRSLQRDLKAMLADGWLAEAGTSPTDPTKRYTLGEEARP